MAKLNYGVTPTSVILRLKLLNSSVTTGAGLTGLTSASAGLIIGTIKIGEAATTAYTQAGATIETITTLGTYETPTATKCRFKEVDATNHPGLYEIHLADARFATTGSLIISVSGATNLAQCDVEVQTSNLNSNLTQILGTAAATPATAGILDINVKNIANAVVNTATAQIGANIVTQANIDFGALQKTSLNAATPASVQNIPATGTGLTAIPWNAAWDAEVESECTDALNVYDPPTRAEATTDKDAILADHTIMKQKVAGTYDRETDSLEAVRDRGDAAWITATGFATPTNITAGVITTVTNLTNAPTVGDFNATMKTSLNAATPASVTGAVGSVTAGVTVATNNDKTGYGLSAAAIQAIWDALTSAFTTAGSIGKKFADWVVGTIDLYTGNTKQTGDSFARLGAPAGVSISADIAVVDVASAAIKVKTDNLPDGIKKNTTFTAFTFLMVDSTNHVTAKTGLTVAGNYSGGGAAVAALTNSVSEISNGLYKVNLTAAELNFETVTLIFTAIGADARIITIHPST